MDSLTSCEHLIAQKNDKFLENYHFVYSYFVFFWYPHKMKTTCDRDQCEYQGPLLVTCMNCTYFGCPRHLNIHLQSTEHSLYINITFGHLFCSQCDNYIYDRDILSIVDKLQKESDCIGTVSLKQMRSLLSNNYIACNNDAPVPGFANLGNTCYLNSVLQIIMHTPMLRNYFLSFKHVCQTEKESEKCILCEINRIYQQAYVIKVDVICIQKLLIIFWEHTRYMASSSQQDAHECFIALLDVIHKQAIVKIKDNSDIRNLEKCKCIVHKMFNGIMRSDIICGSCQNVSSKLDTFIEIPLNFSVNEKGKYPKKTNLMSCLELFGQIEFLNDVDCEICKTKKLSSKQLTIKHLPMILCLILKRFRNSSDNGPGKITTIVEFPETLDMGKFIENKTVTASTVFNECFAMYETIYKLYGVICHKGHANGGHYLCYVLQQGNWYQCNDRDVIKVQLEDVLKSQAYLLFYHKEFMNLYS